MIVSGALAAEARRQGSTHWHVRFACTCRRPKLSASEQHHEQLARHLCPTNASQLALPGAAAVGNEERTARGQLHHGASAAKKVRLEAHAIWFGGWQGDAAAAHDQVAGVTARRPTAAKDEAEGAGRRGRHLVGLGADDVVRGRQDTRACSAWRPPPGIGISHGAIRSYQAFNKLAELPVLNAVSRGAHAAAGAGLPGCVVLIAFRMLAAFSARAGTPRSAASSGVSPSKLSAPPPPSRSCLQGCSPCRPVPPLPIEAAVSARAICPARHYGRNSICPVSKSPVGERLEGRLADQAAAAAADSATAAAVAASGRLAAALGPLGRSTGGWAGPQH